MTEPKIRTLRDRIRDAIRAFKGKEIGAIHFGIDVKRCDKCEYRMGTDDVVLYLCDMKKDCSNVRTCSDCIHTRDIRHAKNFELVNDFYVEKE